LQDAKRGAGHRPHPHFYWDLKKSEIFLVRANIAPGRRRAIGEISRHQLPYALLPVAAVPDYQVEHLDEFGVCALKPFAAMWAATSSTVGFLNLSRACARLARLAHRVSFSLIGGVGGRFSFSFAVVTSASRASAIRPSESAILSAGV
jgi:hypothetical protein